MKETPTAGPGAGRHWPMRMAVVFVLITLLALVMVPWLVQRRVSGLRAQIEASEPARTLVMRWQFDLVREMAALSEVLLTGDNTPYDGAPRVDERRIYEQLEPLAARLGPEVMRELGEARAVVDLWHERVSEEELRQQRAEGVRLMDIPRERTLFSRALRSVAAVDSVIIRETDEIRQRIVFAEETGLRITLVSGLVALLAGMTVLTLQSRVTRFAEEAERRRVQADEALAESARAAEARNRLLRGITHDVKNPLGTAKGYAELLALGIKAPLAPEQAPLVAGVERSVDSALAIIADLLDLARVDSGGVSVRRVEVDLNDVAAEAVADHLPSAETAGHTLEADLADQPVRAHTDPVRVRQVLDNLITNAMKYTPAPGRIVVRAGAPEDDAPPADGEWATITVKDNGPGIPPEYRESVFDEFTRIDESSSNGHGLGLAIARGLSRQLGGDLTLSDRSEGGAVFVLWIPEGRAGTA
ncbi:MAG TPA: HAMP domain-containing sensor histidine kinase [Longimicrobiales bacterium]|nr:HAMP domain-containing sensor histidine kinase [Longimicrobiales bacterium]